MSDISPGATNETNQQPAILTFSGLRTVILDRSVHIIPLVSIRFRSGDCEGLDYPNISFISCSSVVLFGQKHMHE